MATPNYGYEKRQKELAKKRKKEDKLKAKSERKSGVGGEEGHDHESTEQGSSPAQPGDQAPTPSQP